MNNYSYRMTYSMNIKNHNYKIILFIQSMLMVALSISLPFFDKGEDKNIVRGICIGLMISLLIQLCLFSIKPSWFGAKVNKHPHQR